ncbi:Ccdc38, partial [Symbiodinium pilosum]
VRMKTWLWWSLATVAGGIVVGKDSAPALLQISARHLPPIPQPPSQPALPEMPTLPQSVFDVSPPAVRLAPTPPPNASAIPSITKQREA